jgi:uncharacterized protein
MHRPSALRRTLPAAGRSLKVGRARAKRRGLSLARLAVASITSEAALTLGGIVVAHRLNPRPYLLTHLLAGGTLGVGLLTLGAAARLLGWSAASPTTAVPLGLFGLGIASLVGYGFYLEPRWLETPQVEASLAGLPPSLDGLRIALISDLHAGPHFGPQDMNRVVAATNALRPDLIALLGDYVTRDPADVRVAAGGAAGLRAPLGVVGILGNHDHWVNAALVTDALSAAGVRMLRNAGMPIERGGGRLWLAGLDDLRWGRPDLPAALNGAREGEVTVLLAHNPLSVHLAERLGVPLVLSGHTHGGQVRLPGIGPLILPIDDRGLSQGLRRVGNTQIYVTRGVGVGTPPARLGARPEITLLVLRTGDDSRDRAGSKGRRGLRPGAAKG